jgi:hypothetical protein
MRKYEKIKRLVVREPEWFGNNMESYKEHLENVNRINAEIDFQNDRFEKTGIPPYSIKLEVGKNYSGNADDHFQILTINNELWFVTNSGCVEFDEFSDEEIKALELLAQCISENSPSIPTLPNRL